jgi:hypothetical protein
MVRRVVKRGEWSSESVERAVRRAAERGRGVGGTGHAGRARSRSGGRAGGQTCRVHVPWPGQRSNVPWSCGLTQPAVSRAVVEQVVKIGDRCTTVPERAAKRAGGQTGSGQQSGQTCRKQSESGQTRRTRSKRCRTCRQWATRWSNVKWSKQRTGVPPVVNTVVRRGASGRKLVKREVVNTADRCTASGQTCRKRSTQWSNAPQAAKRAAGGQCASGQHCGQT